MSAKPHLTLLLSLLFCLNFFQASVDAAEPSLWKNHISLSHEAFTHSNTSLKDVLQQLVQESAQTPQAFYVSDKLTQTIGLPWTALQFSNANTFLQWLEAKYDVALVKQQNQWWFVPKTDVWKHRVYERVFKKPIPVTELLNDLSQVGEVSIQYDTKLFSKLQIALLPPQKSVQALLQHLAKQGQWQMEYHPELHRVSLLHPDEIALKTLALPSLTWSLVQKQLPLLQQAEPLMQHLSVYPISETSSVQPPLVLMLKGQSDAVERLKTFLLELDHMHQTLPSLYPAITLRMPLRYLDAQSKKVSSEGQSLILPGIVEQLQSIQQRLFPEWQSASQKRPAVEVMADVIGNAVILRGSQQHVQTLQHLLEQWDQPQPLIKIEAHIFETTETFSRTIGTQLQAHGVPAGGDAPTALSTEAFTAGATLGPLNATRAFQVDALLSALESEGKGRILSRPVVVTTNNIEAEMNSGSIINVRLAGNQNTAAKLKEIKTGVILRVTPRLIEADTNQTNHRIKLNIFAETSSPSASERVDGIPQINRQRADSQVVVQNGKTFLLGGLVKDRQLENESGVPWLKDIPILGYLFKTEANTSQFDHVLVFVTPTLIAPDTHDTLPSFSGL